MIRFATLTYFYVAIYQIDSVSTMADIFDDGDKFLDKILNLDVLTPRSLLDYLKKRFDAGRGIYEEKIDFYNQKQFSYWEPGKITPMTKVPVLYTTRHEDYIYVLGFPIRGVTKQDTDRTEKGINLECPPILARLIVYRYVLAFSGHERVTYVHLHKSRRLPDPIDMTQEDFSLPRIQVQLLQPKIDEENGYYLTEPMMDPRAFVEFSFHRMQHSDGAWEQFIPVDAAGEPIACSEPYQFRIIGTQRDLEIEDIFGSGWLFQMLQRHADWKSQPQTQDIETLDVLNQRVANVYEPRNTEWF